MLSEQYLQKRKSVNQQRARINSDILKKRGISLKNATMLEVGSQLGFGLAAIRQVKYAIGLEINLDTCKQGKVLTDITCVNGSAESLPFSDNTFDYVQSYHVIEHMPPEMWEEYISEIYRVLKPNSTCILAFPQKHYPIEGHYKLPFLHWLPPKWRPLYSRLRRPQHLSKLYKTTMAFTEFPTLKQITALVTKDFNLYEDITNEFLNHPIIKARLGHLKHMIARLFINTPLCPERKFLLHTKKLNIP